jgi:hypothetical protein
MALIKIIGVGEELVFDLTSVKPGANQISITLTEKAGRQAVLKIDADRSIGIIHTTDKKVWFGMPA